MHWVVTIILAALGTMLSAALAETPVERGGYLANAIMACDGCHTPRPPGGAFDMNLSQNCLNRITRQASWTKPRKF